MQSKSPLRGFSLAMALVALLTAPCARAASNGLDPGFGDNGSVILAPSASPPGTDDNDLLYASVLDRNGGILVAGSSFRGNARGSDFAVMRLHADGKMDSTFGVNGVAFVGFDGEVTTSSDLPYAIGVDSKGRIVIAGATSVGAGYHIALARLTPSGVLDTTFGAGGKVITSFNGSEAMAAALAIDASDRIVVSGWVRSLGFADSNYLTVRYHASGQQDTSFPVWFVDFGGGPDSASAVKIDAYGRIVVAGTARVGGKDGFGLVRFHPNGSFDSSFDGDGKATVSYGDRSYASALEIDRQNRIVVVGSTDNGQWRQMLLARLLDNGSLDPSCGGGGSGLLLHSHSVHFSEPGTTTTHAWNHAAAVTIGWPVPHIYVAGQTALAYGGTRSALIGRFDSDCRPDGYGANGLSATRATKLSLGNEDKNVHASAILLDSTGGAIVAGSWHGNLNWNFAVARFAPNRLEDVAIDFGQNGLWVFANYGWRKLHAASPKAVVSADLDGNRIDDLVVDFGSTSGMWVWKNDTTWVKLHALSSESMVAGDFDGNGKRDLAVDFGSQYGIWVWKNDSAWAKLHALSPESMGTGDIDGHGKEELIVSFGPTHGLWMWVNDVVWSKLHALAPEGFVAANLDGREAAELVVDFGPTFGVWLWRKNIGWGSKPLHATSPEAMVAGDLDSDPRDELVFDFGSQGLWVMHQYPGYFDPNAWGNPAWAQLDVRSPGLMITANADGKGGDDLIVSSLGGAPGISMIRNYVSSWESIHGTSPESMVGGNLDRF